MACAALGAEGKHCSADRDALLVGLWIERDLIDVCDLFMSS